MIKLSNVSKKYFGYSEVLCGINFSIAKGEKVAVYGCSGSGKTTLLKLISGLEEPTAGEITANDINIHNIKLRDRNIAMVFEDLAIPKYSIGLKVLMRPLRLRGMSRKESIQIARKMAEEHGIVSVMDLPGILMRPYYKVKLAVARAFIRKSEYILIDNPLKHLDIISRREYIKELVSLINNSEATVIYATDDIEELKYFNGRIVMLEAGYIAQQGALSEIIAKPLTISVGKRINPDYNYLKAIKEENGKITIYSDTMPKSFNNNANNVILRISPDDIIMRSNGSYSIIYKYTRADRYVCAEFMGQELIIKAEEIADRIDIILDNALIYSEADEKILI